MAKIIKCNFCGKDIKIDRRKKGFKGIHWGLVDLNGYKEPTEALNTCPKCMQKFIKTINDMLLLNGEPS